MPNFLLGWPNVFVSGALVASAQEAALPVTNLANDQGAASMGWQCPALSAFVTVDPGQAVLYRVISLHRTNLTTAATWRVRVFAGATSDTAVVFDTAPAGGSLIGMGIVPRFGQAVLVLPIALAGRLVRIDVQDPTNPDGHLNIAQAFAGPAFQPVRNLGYGSSKLRVDSTATTETRSGAEIVRPDWQRRGYDMDLGAVTPAEVPIVDDLDGQARLGGNLLFVPNPSSPFINREAVFGRLKPAAGIGYANNSAQTRTWRATITERL